MSMQINSSPDPIDDNNFSDPGQATTQKKLAGTQRDSGMDYNQGRAGGNMIPDGNGGWSNSYDQGMPTSRDQMSGIGPGMGAVGIKMPPLSGGYIAGDTPYQPPPGEAMFNYHPPDSGQSYPTQTMNETFGPDQSIKNLGMFNSGGSNTPNPYNGPIPKPSTGWNGLQRGGNMLGTPSPNGPIGGQLAGLGSDMGNGGALAAGVGQAMGAAGLSQGAPDSGPLTKMGSALGGAAGALSQYGNAMPDLPPGSNPDAPNQYLGALSPGVQDFSSGSGGLKSAMGGAAGMMGGTSGGAIGAPSGKMIGGTSGGAMGQPGGSDLLTQLLARIQGQY